jgi:hypothetical protein
VSHQLGVGYAFIGKTVVKGTTHFCAN